MSVVRGGKVPPSCPLGLSLSSPFHSFPLLRSLYSFLHLCPAFCSTASSQSPLSPLYVVRTPILPITLVRTVEIPIDEEREKEIESHLCSGLLPPFFDLCLTQPSFPAFLPFPLIESTSRSFSPIVSYFVLSCLQIPRRYPTRPALFLPCQRLEDDYGPPSGTSREVLDARQRFRDLPISPVLLIRPVVGSVLYGSRVFLSPLTPR